MERAANCSVIRNIPIFSSYAESELHDLANTSHIKKYRKNTIVIMEGDETNSVFFILEGAVRVFHENQRGREITLNELKVGEFFGELAWMSSGKRNASVITKQNTKLLILRSKDFERFYYEHSELSHALSIKYAKMISSLSKQLEAVALKEIQSRVLWAIESYANDESGNFSSSLTHKDIANLIGSSRESVSRAVNELKSTGYIKQTKDFIQLVSKL